MSLYYIPHFGHIFTLSERTQLNYTMGDAVVSANRVLLARGGRRIPQTDLQVYPLRQRCTLEEVNAVADTLIKRYS